MVFERNDLTEQRGPVAAAVANLPMETVCAVLLGAFKDSFAPSVRPLGVSTNPNQALTLILTLGTAARGYGRHLICQEVC